MPALESYRRENPYSYAPGIFPSLEALKKTPQRVRRLLLSEEAAGEGVQVLKELCEQRNIRIEYASRFLRRLSGKENCFAAAVIEKSYTGLTGDKHIVLHHTSDRGNLGTILRTALGFGYRDIAMITPCADVYDPHVIRSSMGAVFSLRIREYESFSAYKDDTDPKAYYPFMLQSSVPADTAAAIAPEQHALIFGNEGSGLPEEFQYCGTPVRIRQNHEVDSLNLAVAAAVGMYLFGGGKENGSGSDQE